MAGDLEKGTRPPAGFTGYEALLDDFLLLLFLLLLLLLDFFITSMSSPGRPPETAVNDPGVNDETPAESPGKEVAPLLRSGLALKTAAFSAPEVIARVASERRQTNFDFMILTGVVVLSF